VSGSVRTMTIRGYIQKRTRRIMFIGIGSWLLIATTAFLSEDKPNSILEIIGIVGFAGAILSIMFFVKCPRCGARLGQLGMAQPFGISAKQRVNFCPHCGVNFDEQVEL
jgi:hypothetical protein